MERETYKRIGEAAGTIFSIAEKSINGIKGMRQAPPIPGSGQKVLKAISETWEKREELKWVAEGAKNFAEDNIVPQAKNGAQYAKYNIAPLAKNGAKIVTDFIAKK